MNRKHFLSSVLASAALLPVKAGVLHIGNGAPPGAEIASHTENSIQPAGDITALSKSVSSAEKVALPAGNGSDISDPAAIVPPYLKQGDTVGIVCPAGFITLPEIQPAIRTLQSWGLNCRPGNTVGRRDGSFGGTDDERARDLQEMLDDTSVKAILCARGGYGSVRILDKLDLTRFKAAPKWIIGFSDITVLHCHINRNYGIASIHSKMCNSFPDDLGKADPVQQDSILSIRRALMGEALSYTVAPHLFNRAGSGAGALVGGNLKTIESLAGSVSDLRTTRKILFVEDTGEYLYSIDRMFWSLKRAGKLEALSGLIIGGFRIRPDDPGEEFGRDLYEIVMEKVEEYAYPVCFNFPVGHQRDNFALKYGMAHSLEVGPAGGRLWI